MSPAAPKTTLCSRDLRAMRHAGDALLEVMQLLQRKGCNVVTELLPGALAMTEWDHYPANDAFDAGSGFRWYYHTHPDAQRGDEHGHFHLFARAPKSGYTHLLGLSVSPAGLPLRAFTTNRWVTNEVYAPAGRVLRRLQRFQLQRPQGLALVHRWLTAVIGVFRPQLVALLEARDRRVDAALLTRPNLFEDRRTMLLSQCQLDLQLQLEWLDEVGDNLGHRTATRVRKSGADATPQVTSAGTPPRGTRGLRQTQFARAAHVETRAAHRSGAAGAAPSNHAFGETR